MVKPSDLSFKTLCDFFTATARASGLKRKNQLLKSLLERNLQRDDDDVFEVIRLILPHRDNHRGNYDLKEAKLALVLCKACSVDPKVNSSAQHAVDWKKPTTVNAGNFPAVMEEYLFRANCGKHEQTEGERSLKIGVLNAKLDELVQAKSDEKAKVLQWLVRNTSPPLMRWIVHIILKDMKIGITENTFFREYHPDAEALFNVTMDLRKVASDLKDKSHRLPKKDVEPGHPVRPQLATAVRSPLDAFTKMKGKSFVVETKFDGERMQVHKSGDSVYYWSRNATEHGEQYGYNIFDDVIKSQVKQESFILDGEIVAWNKIAKKFEPFGGLKSAFHAAKNAKAANAVLEMVSWDGTLMTTEPDYDNPLVGDIEIIYVVFDVLYCDDQSVIDRPLRDRYDILNTLIEDAPADGIELGKSSITGRVAPLLPQRPFLDDINCCRISQTEEDIQNAFEDAIRVQEEGIIVKALDSPWKANDRSSAWLKLKPDYVHQSEIDAVVIGAYYGSGGTRSGNIGQYLLALADNQRARSDRPSSFLSFCRVGTGLNAEEREAVAEQLRPYFIQANPKNPNSPSCYKVTGSRRETPDVWISDPYKSVVFEIAADVRTITSKSFATHHSLRFPRVQRIRWDKTAADVQSQGELWEMMQMKRDGTGEVSLKPGKKRQAQAKERAGPPTVASAAFAAEDVSNVKAKTTVLKDAKIMVLSYGAGRKSKHSVAEMVAELGGQMHMNIHPGVTHFLAEEEKHWQVKICIQRSYDVLFLDWLIAVADACQLVVPKPHHYIFISRETRNQNPAMDQNGDLFAVDCSSQDIRALLEKHVPVSDAYSALNSAHRAKKTDTVLQLEQDMVAMGQKPAPASLFRGCAVCIVATGSGDASGAFPTIEDHNTKHLGQVIRLCGGRTTAQIDEDTTHVAILERSGEEPLATERFLHLVQSTAGGVKGVEYLQVGLKANRVSIVRSSWVEQSWVKTQDARGPIWKREEEGDHLHPLALQSFADWPWEAFGVTKRTKRSSAEGAGSEGRKRARRDSAPRRARQTQQPRKRRGAFKIRNPESSGELSEGKDVETVRQARPRKLIKHSTSREAQGEEQLGDAALEEEPEPKRPRRKLRRAVVSSDEEECSFPPTSGSLSCLRDTDAAGKQEESAQQANSNETRTGAIPGSGSTLLTAQLAEEDAEMDNKPTGPPAETVRKESSCYAGSASHLGRPKLLAALLTDGNDAPSEGTPEREPEATQREMTCNKGDVDDKEPPPIKPIPPAVPPGGLQDTAPASGQPAQAGRRLTLKERLALQGIGVKKSQ